MDHIALSPQSYIPVPRSMSPWCHIPAQDTQCVGKVWPCANHEVHQAAHQLWVPVLSWCTLFSRGGWCQAMVDSEWGLKPLEVKL